MGTLVQQRGTYAPQHDIIAPHAHLDIVPSHPIIAAPLHYGTSHNARPCKKPLVSWFLGLDNIRPSKCTWWFIPLSKWVITPVISGLTPLIPFIPRVVTHLLSGMSHQVQVKILKPRLWGTHSFFEQHPQRNINSCATVDWWSSPHVVVCHPTLTHILPSLKCSQNAIYLPTFTPKMTQV